MVKGYYPTTIAEALEYRSQAKDALLISGGTDVMVVKKQAPEIILLNGIKEMKEVTYTGDKIVIGAGVSYRDLLENEQVPQVLKQAMRQIASPAIRSAGTVAGNICNASPAGDTLPVLYALDAKVICSRLENGNVVERAVPIKDFILGVRKIALEANEIVTAIEISKASYEDQTKIYYEKVGARASEAISKLSFVGMYTLEADKISDIRVAFGSVGVTALRFPEIEEQLKGKTLTEISEHISEYVEAFMANIHPIDDQRSTAEYRCQICRNLIKDFLTA